MKSRARANRRGLRVVAVPPKGEPSRSGMRFEIVGLAELLAAALADVEEEINAQHAAR